MEGGRKEKKGEGSEGEMRREATGRGKEREKGRGKWGRNEKAGAWVKRGYRRGPEG